MPSGHQLVGLLGGDHCPCPVLRLSSLCLHPPSPTRGRARISKKVIFCQGISQLRRCWRKRPDHKGVQCPWLPATLPWIYPHTLDPLALPGGFWNFTPTGTGSWHLASQESHSHPGLDIPESISSFLPTRGQNHQTLLGQDSRCTPGQLHDPGQRRDPSQPQFPHL